MGGNTTTAPRGEPAGSPHPVLFLGTSHIDPLCGERLSRALERHRPGIVLLEVSRLSILLRMTLGRVYDRALRRSMGVLGIPENAEIRYIRASLALPAEYLATRDYCRRNGARCVLIDMSLFSLARYPFSYRLVTRKNLKAVSRLNGDRFDGERRIASRIFVEGDDTARRARIGGFRKDPLLMRREEMLCRRTARRVAAHAGEKVAYVGGWEHLIDDPQGTTLYSRLAVPREREIVFLD